jgi:hypothetical protein
MSAEDVRDVKFYVIEDSDPPETASGMTPLQFDAAYVKADALVRGGHRVHVMYTDGATQMELTRFAYIGVPVGLAPEG